MIVRGIERRRIFRDDRDRCDFLDRLERVLPETGMSCYAWTLMPNHVHLVVRTGSIPVATVMARVNTGYALCFNRRHARVGYLFQGRYKSILIEREEHLLALVRYVHLNPLRAGIVSSLEDLGRYRWTGHATLLGNRAARFQNAQRILAEFGEGVHVARRRLLEWMRIDPAASDVIAQASLAPAVESRDTTTEPVSDRASIVTLPGDQFWPARRPSRPESELPELIDQVCQRRRVLASELLARVRSRPVADARAEVVFRASVELGLAGTAIARILGLSKAGVSQAKVRGRTLVGLGSDADGQKLNF